MTALPIIVAPDPVLKQKSAAIESVDDETRELLDDMLDTMYRMKGIGLAAVQVGILKRAIPDQFSDVVRPKSVKIRYLDEHGKPQELQADGLLATCIQHEIDHMNGITFVDHISRLKRDIILKKLTKAKKMGVFDHHDHDHVHGEHCNH